MIININKPIKTGAVCFLIALGVSLISVIFSYIPGIAGTIFRIIFGLAYFALILFFWNSFIVLGKKTGNKKLETSGKVFLALTVLMAVFSVVSMIWMGSILTDNPTFAALQKFNTGEITDISQIPGFEGFSEAALENMDASQMEAYESQMMSQLFSSIFEPLKSYMVVAGVIYGIICIIGGIYSIVFSLGLIRLGKQDKDLKIAKPAGIFYMIYVIGIILAIVLMVPAMIILFNYLMQGNLEALDSSSGVWLIFMILGMILMLLAVAAMVVALILLLILLFRASKKFEEGKSGEKRAEKIEKKAAKKIVKKRR